MKKARTSERFVTKNDVQKISRKLRGITLYYSLNEIPRKFCPKHYQCNSSQASKVVNLIIYNRCTAFNNSVHNYMYAV